MEENYRARMVTSVRLEVLKSKEILELQKKIKKLEETPEVKQYLNLKFRLYLLSQETVGRDKIMEEEKSYVFGHGCSCQSCLFTGYDIGYIGYQKMARATFSCLDCGGIIIIPKDEEEQFRKEHRVINNEPIEQKDYEPNIVEALRDYYFNLLMNSSSEEALRIFILTYGEILDSKKINSDSVSR